MEVGTPPSAAPRTSSPPRPASVPLVAGGSLPLAFIVLGLCAFTAAALWMALEPSLLGLPHLHPRVVSLVHLWLPGFLLSVCIGAMYQLMPVVLGAPLAMRVRMLWIHFSLHALGLILLVPAFALGRFEWVGLGGAFITVGVCILFLAVMRTFLGAKRRDAAAWGFPMAAGWLVITVFFGVALAINRRWPWLPLSAADLLRAHAHLGLVGFFLTLLQGTTFQLIPMFTMGELRRPRFVWTGLLLSQIGLFTLGPGLAWNNSPLEQIGAVVLSGGILCSGIALQATLRMRRRRTLEPGLKAFAVGVVALGIAAVIGTGLVFAPAGHPSATRWIEAYGIVIIPGALSLVVLGMLFKIVPFLVWMRAYGPKVGKQPVPLATALASRALEQIWLVGHLTGLGLLLASVALSSHRVALAGGVTLVIAAAFFLVNMGRVLSHLGIRHGPVVPTISPPKAPARFL